MGFEEPTAEEMQILEDLGRAADLRRESYRLYLAVFRKAVEAGFTLGTIGRYAGISSQAVNSTKKRLAKTVDHNAPESIDDVLARVERRARRR